MKMESCLLSLENAAVTKIKMEIILGNPHSLVIMSKR